MFSKLHRQFNDSEIGIINISRIIAVTSFILGTFIFGFFYLTKSTTLIFIGFFYLIGATVVNSIYLIGLFIKILSKDIERKQVLISVFIMLINIPIAIIYFEVVLDLFQSIID